MAIVRWRPMVRPVLPLEEEVNRIMRNFLRVFGEEESPFETFPAVDIREKEDSFVIEAEIPGMDKNDIKVSVQDDVITISGEKKVEREVKGYEHIRIERSCGKFSRSFRLGIPVEADKVKAKYKNGVLTITVPKSEKVRGKEIPIEVS